MKRPAIGIGMVLLVWPLLAADTTIAVDTFPMSAVSSSDGKYLLVMNAGAHAPSISVIDLAASRELSRMPVPDAWLGLTITKAGDKVYVGGGSRAAVFEFSFTNGVLTAGRTFALVAEKDRTPLDFAGDVQLSPDGHLLYVANLYRDSIVVLNPQSGFILSQIKTGRRPYRILFHPSGKTLYATSWADGTIGQYDVNSGERLAVFRVAPHPTDMLWVEGGIEGQPEIKARLLVPGANTNSVYVMGASESGVLTKLETINLGLTGREPLGITPSALALSADKKWAYVACSDANLIATVGISTGDRSVVAGYTQTGLYPTSVRGLADGRFAVLNGRSGTVQLLDPRDDEKLAADTNLVITRSPYSDDKMDSPLPDGTLLRPGGPLKHVIYVVRDGNTSDAASAPNRDKLMHDFVSFGHFVSVADNSAEGVNWATAAIAPDYTRRLSPNSEAGRRKVYDYEGQEPANSPPAGYLWNSATQSGLKIRNYGFQVHNRAQATADGQQVDRVYDPALTDSTDMEYRGPDPQYPDTQRAREFADEVKDFGELGELPQLLLVRIGNDDQALGIIADAVSKSRFWNDIAMFVTDASGARATTLVISPFAKRGFTDDTVYDQLSVLRTAEIVLGLRPMTTFDASASPLFSAFTTTSPATH